MNANGTLTLNVDGDNPALVKVPEGDEIVSGGVPYSSDLGWYCCTNCPCARYEDILDGSCCGLLQSYSVRMIGDFGTRFVGDVTVTAVPGTSSRFGCVWEGVGGVVEILRSDETWEPIGAAFVQLIAGFESAYAVQWGIAPGPASFASFKRVAPRVLNVTGVYDKGPFLESDSVNAAYEVS